MFVVGWYVAALYGKRHSYYYRRRDGKYVRTREVYDDLLRVMTHDFSSSRFMEVLAPVEPKWHVNFYYCLRNCVHTEVFGSAIQKWAEKAVDLSSY